MKNLYLVEFIAMNDKDGELIVEAKDTDAVVERLSHVKNIKAINSIRNIGSRDMIIEA